MTHKFNATFGESPIEIETGKLAQLAAGSVTVRLGDTVVLATAVVADKPRDNIDFFPLMVDYEERMYAAGKISGSRFVKREGRPSEDAILSGRLIDRPLRPLFTKGFFNDVQVVVTVLSADLINDPDIVGITAASAAVMQTTAPFKGPVAGVRVGRVNGKLIANPTYEQRDASDLDLVVAGTKDAIMMVEAGASEVSEEDIIAAITFAHESMQPALDLQLQMVEAMGRQEVAHVEEGSTTELKSQLATEAGSRLQEALFASDKATRYASLETLRQQLFEKYVTEEMPETAVADAFEHIVAAEFRRNILQDGRRPDGRKLDEIRPITIEVGVLPRPHGSALFTRGETQALSVVTLGSLEDEQMIDTMEQDTTKRYMHHYNFPPYSVNEAKPMRSTGRREIGHGALAERALVPVIPDREEFPYTIRVVSEILSSNGSSSMASVCGSSLSLMDAGVPIKKAVAGVAMGLVTDGTNYKVLSDISGIEDHEGDIDFKVAGTRDGITALQMDIKVGGVPTEVLKDALAQAKVGRFFILDKIQEILSAPRPELSQYAPRVITVKVPPTRIGEVIGPGGKVINEIIDKAGGKAVTSISIQDDGTTYITSTNAALAEQAAQTIRDMVREIQPGEKFSGRVTRIMDFGAFVEVLPGKEGLVHISQLANHRVEKVTDVVKLGDTLEVVVTEIDDLGRINLSHKALENKDIDRA